MHLESMNPSYLFASLFLIAQLLFASVSTAQTDPENSKDVVRAYINAIGHKKQKADELKLKVTEREILTNDVGMGESHRTHNISGRKLVTVAENYKIWFLGGQPWGGLSKRRATNSLPVSFWHPTEFPKFIENYPAKLRLVTPILERDSTVKLLADPIFEDVKTNYLSVPLSLYFDRKTKLLKKIEYKYRTVSFSNYRDVNGIMYPHKIVDYSRSPAGLSCRYERTIVDIEKNPKFNVKLFELPKKFKPKE